MILNHKEIRTAAGNHEEGVTLFDRFSSACSDLKQRMTSEVFGSAKDHVIRRYVQFHQAGLITLSDQVFQQLQSIKQPLIPGETALLVHILEAIQQILAYISQQFYAHFDSVHSITQFQSDQQQNMFRTDIEHIAPLLEKAPIEPALRAVFLSSMEELLDYLRIKTISTDQLRYFERLLKMIRLHLEDEASDTKSFCDLLYHQNFNSPHFEVWYRENYLQLPMQKNFKEDQRLAIHPVLTTDAIYPDRQPLDVLLRERLVCISGHPSGKLEKSQNQIRKIRRLPLLLSVPQLALFVRLCYLENCFQISNISNIMRFFTEHFETKKQANISLKSFSRAFYKSDQATAAMVRDFLQRMVSIIDKTYFPKT